MDLGEFCYFFPKVLQIRKVCLSLQRNNKYPRIMATISLDSTLYNQAKNYANADGMSVEEWVAMLITRFTPTKKKKFKMKKIEELSPELQALIGFAKPEVPNDDDINGDKARTEYLTDKYAL